MKFHSIVLASVILAGCSDATSSPVVVADAGTEATPQNNDNTDGGLCCSITHKFPNGPDWMSGFYYCVTPSKPLNPFNPPWICNSNIDGQCGDGTGLECLTCFDPKCVVGMTCRDADGTGTVIPCK